MDACISHDGHPSTLNWPNVVSLTCCSATRAGMEGSQSGTVVRC